MVADALSKAQAAFADFQQALKKRSTSAPFENWYDYGRMKSFEMTPIEQGLKALVSKYGKR